MPYKKRTGIIVSDIHCASSSGLTPPQWQWRKIKNDIHGHNKMAAVQNELWSFWDKKLEPLRPIDFAFWIGDLIEGPNEKDNGVNLITTDLNKQQQMAVECIEFVNAKHNVFVYGSNYHVQRYGIEFEDDIAHAFNGKIGIHEFIDVNGVVFNLKHHPASNSYVPHTRGTALGKDLMFQKEWSLYKKFPDAGIIVRAHRHWYHDTGDSRYRIFALPAMKMLGRSNLAKYYHQVIDSGFLSFEIEDKNNWSWQFHEKSFDNYIPKVLKI